MIGDDPSRVTAHRVRHLEDHVLNDPDDIDPIFSVGLTSIDLLKTSLVKENTDCEIEPDAVLCEIRFSLGMVPFKGSRQIHGPIYGIPAR